MSFGHYTQCVWKYTTKVGMGVSKDSSGTSWVVARYQKPGNMQYRRKALLKCQHEYRRMLRFGHGHNSSRESRP
ncbi:hypothetical protein FOIG_16928 [Fusarium odoratissimum NRRL 54006]|uniref:SCP domain-containing protein n=1 Tax=Fusarium odoratissimum (strain NRRL 54006) TaxID=1089451 RepID=X0ILP4_FUSO5|nr:uncharacterized protein FOIG_16928 [Fusarium odoratissimum NRRL 54006]EXL89788.1 hypothetical protein FOIG_16928 [Fusarium odoratissimum NRRL 54006]